MLFNSLEFLVFIPVVVIVYFSISQRWRWLWLLAASYFFYMSWRPIYGILLFATTLLDYGLAILMGRTQTSSLRILLLLISLVTNLGMLFLFKYYNLIANSVNSLVGWFSQPPLFANLDLVLPIGISFYVLQTLGYTIDVYRRRLEPERHLGIFMLYVSFFPQLVAGPIERAGSLLPQLRQQHFFDERRATDGLMLMGWGFFKKLVIADNLGFYVNPIFANPGQYQGWTVLIAAYFFAFQIYCDFSGYSDIAIGCARILGIDLMVNFRRPFLATSIQEFWRRWHISLTTWFRDYVYFPLGGSRGVSERRTNLNTFIVFLISGLWHGAQWTYVFWGVLNGVFYLLNKELDKWQDKWLRLPSRFSVNAQWQLLQKIIGAIVVFNLFSLSLIFFRARTFADAFQLIAGITYIAKVGIINSFNAIYLSRTLITVYNFNFPVILFVGLAVLMGVELLQEIGVSPRRWIGNLPTPMRWSAYYLFAMVILLFGSYSSQTIFIYFQF